MKTRVCDFSMVLLALAWVALAVSLVVAAIEFNNGEASIDCKIRERCPSLVIGLQKIVFIDAAWFPTNNATDGMAAACCEHINKVGGCERELLLFRYHLTGHHYEVVYDSTSDF